MGKTAIWTTLYFYPLSPLNNVEKQRAKLASIYVMGSKRTIKNSHNILSLIVDMCCRYFGLFDRFFGKYFSDVGLFSKSDIKVEYNSLAVYLLIETILFLCIRS